MFFKVLHEILEFLFAWSVVTTVRQDGLYPEYR
jgi:hypothetical protein